MWVKGTSVLISVDPLSFAAWGYNFGQGEGVGQEHGRLDIRGASDNGIEGHR